MNHIPVVPLEALPSYFIRLQRVNGITARGACELGMGKARWSGVDWTVPTGLRDFVSKFGEPLGRGDANYWVSTHTLAPYFASTLTAVRREAFQGRLLETNCGPRRPLLPVAVDEWLAGPPLICPECEEHFQRTLGHSVVLRQWLLPFATRCSDHGELLQQCGHWTPLSARKLAHRRLLADREAHSLELTASVESLLLGERDLLSELGALFQSRGLVTAKGSIRRKPLVSHLVQFGQGRFEHPELDGLLGSAAKVEALLAPLWNGRGTLHPSVAAILINALEALEPASQSALWEPRRHVRSAELDAALAGGQRPTRAAVSFGISVQSAIQRAMELGIPVGRRPKVMTPELTRQVKEQLMAGQAVSVVAGSTGLSQSTVYRILSASTELKEVRTSRLSNLLGDELSLRRERFAALVQGHPEMGPKDLRGLAPADYAYLYRVDRDWLKELMPAPMARGKSKPPRSRAPQGADDALAEKVSRASAQTKNARAPKQTVTAVLQNAGRTFAHVPMATMPKTAAALSAATESLRTYVFRRLLWTVQRLRQEGRWAPDWQVKKESGLRAEIIDAAGVQVSDVVARAEVLRMEELLHEA